MESARRWSLILILALLPTTSRPALAQTISAGLSLPDVALVSEIGQAVQITVRVSNRVSLPRSKLSQAEGVATQILNHAGVQIVWIDCSIAITASTWDPTCDPPFGPTDLIINFVKEVRSLSSAANDDTLGFTAVPYSGGQAERAYISNERAKKAAQRFAVPSELILGLATAHEIGHLLTDSGKHSLSGLMRAQWDAEDLARAARGDLQFTDDEVKKLHANINARIAHTSSWVKVRNAKEDCRENAFSE